MPDTIGHNERPDYLNCNRVLLRFDILLFWSFVQIHRPVDHRSGIYDLPLRVYRVERKEITDSEKAIAFIAQPFQRV